jgi:hypothetical protein
LASPPAPTYNPKHAHPFFRREEIVSKSALRWAACFLAAALSLAPARAQNLQPSTAASEPRSLEPPTDVLVASGPAPDLILLYTGDVIGFLDPCG